MITLQNETEQGNDLDPYLKKNMSITVVYPANKGINAYFEKFKTF
jgi:hypothetical protein